MSDSPDPADLDELFQRLAAFDTAAFGQIVTLLRDKLLRAARRRLEREPELSGLYDEEDALQSASSLIWARILGGWMEPPGGIDEFLRLARTIIVRRITRRARAERARKRNPAPFDEPAWGAGRLDRYVPDGVDVFRCMLPRPEAKAIAEDETRWLLSLLPQPLREIAEARLFDGYTVEQIARKKGVSVTTVARQFREIKAIWQQAVQERGE